MEEQPEALRLIKHMDDEWQEDWDGRAIRAELRRLHGVNQELLGALETFAECELNDNNCASLGVDTMRIRAVARAAIAKATGETE